MRSVQLFPAMRPQRLTSVLDEIGERAGSEWFGIADGRLEVKVEEHESMEDLLRSLQDEGSWSATEIDALQKAGGGELGGSWVEVRVSGRVDGQEEMRSLVLRLLAEGGYGFDDYSDRAWSLEEIRDGLPTGETFRA